MIELSCHCGQVRVEADRQPDYLNECNCTLCRKTGARWAYYDPAQVRVTGPTRSYRRNDKPEANAQVHFCGECGATTHFVLTEQAIARVGNTLTGVNMRLADERDLAGIELRFPDGRAWDGASEFGYVSEPRLLG